MMFRHTGTCPNCGAPIYGYGDVTEDVAPTAHFTCPCHRVLQKPMQDEEGETVEESLDEADRRHLARNRPAADTMRTEGDHG